MEQAKKAFLVCVAGLVIVASTAPSEARRRTHGSHARAASWHHGHPWHRGQWGYAETDLPTNINAGVLPFPYTGFIRAYDSSYGTDCRILGRYAVDPYGRTYWRRFAVCN